MEAVDLCSDSDVIDLRSDPPLLDYGDVKLEGPPSEHISDFIDLTEEGTDAKSDGADPREIGSHKATNPIEYTNSVDTSVSNSEDGHGPLSDETMQNEAVIDLCSEDNVGEANSASIEDLRPFVKSVHMENFMCHANFRVDLIPSVNLICGTNGSGKSTVLSALMVVLGSRVRATSRAESIGQLIMSGKNMAVVHVTINIPPKYTRLYAKYGREVTITRKIRVKNSTYEFRDCDNRLVKGDGVKDVRTICNQFNIYPDNELAMLNQENAKEFLVHASPQRKYEKLHRALLQNSIQESQSVVIAQTKTQKLLIDQLRLRIAEQESQKERANAVLNAVNMHREKQKLLKEISRLLAWREFHEVDERKSSANTKVDTLRQELEHLRTQSDTAEKAEELRNEISQCKARLQTLSDEFKKLQEDIEAATSELEESEALVRRIDDDIEKYDSDHSRLRGQLRQVQIDASHHNPEQLEKRREELEVEREELRRRRLDLLTQKENAEAELVEAEGALSRLTNQFLEDEYRDKVLQHKTLTGELLSADNPRLALEYTARGGRNNHSKHEQLKRSLAQVRWLRPPVGPLYTCLQVKDDGIEYVPALESFWRTTLDSWWVQTSEDRDNLRKLADKISFPVNILMRKDDRFSFESGLPAKSSNYRRVVDILEVKEEAVLRILVDQNRVDMLVLTSGMNSAFEASKQRNVRDALTIVKAANGSTNFQVVSKLENRQETSYVDPSNMGLIKVGNAAQKRLLQNELRAVERDLAVLKERLINHRDEVRAAEFEVSNRSAVVARFNDEILLLDREAAEKVEQIASIDTDYTDRDFDAELEVLQTDVDTVARHAQDARTTRLELEEDVIIARESANGLKQRLTPKRAELSEARGTVDAAQRSLDRLMRKSSENTYQVSAKERQLNAAEAHARTTDVEFEEALTKFRDAHGEPPAEEELRKSEFFDASPRALSEEIEKLTSEGRVAERTVEQIAAAERDLESAISETRRLEAIREEMLRDEKICASGQAIRTAHERDTWNRLKREIQAHFQHVLSLRNYSGKIEIDDERGKLLAHATPGARAATTSATQGNETLSGGEKSLTQIALLMAVWQSMDLGLVAMDEYDVFMDKDNRSVSLQCIAQTVQKMAMQCIIITPQDIDTSALEGVEFQMLPMATINR